MSEQQPIGILLISTRKYKQFVQSLVNQIDEYFLPEHDKIIFVFTDEWQEVESENTVYQVIVPSYKWPYPTLFRYKIFHENREKLKCCSHLFYMDVDMAIVSRVGNEFLVDEGLVVVRHPGFYVINGWGDSSNPKESTSYMEDEKRKHYYCGGVQGGTSKAYLELSKELSENIDIDEQNGIRAEWNDETHFNKYVNENTEIPITEFTPSYCMVEEKSLREKWGINELPVKIIALAKNHAEIRN